MFFLRGPESTITTAALDLTEGELYGQGIQIRNHRIQEYGDPGWSVT
jgi:hypothetical protein